MDFSEVELVLHCLSLLMVDNELHSHNPQGEIPLDPL